LQSLADRGRAMDLLGQARECVTALLPGQALALRQQAQLPLQSADFYTQLGRCERANGSPTAARPFFQRALALRRDPLHDEPGVVESLADLASLEVDAGHPAAALRGYRQALTRLRLSAGPRHPLAIELLRRSCALEHDAGALDAAETDCNRALALALDLHGRFHPSTMDVREQLARIQADLGRFGDAAAALRDLRAWHVARFGPADDRIAVDDARLGDIALQQGDVAAALAGYDRAIAIHRWRHQPVALAATLAHKAEALHLAGADDDARAALLEARRLRSVALGPADALVGDTERQLGEVDAALGRYEQARHELDHAVTLLRRTDRASPRTHRAELALATLRARHGEASALGDLDALARLPQRDLQLRDVAWLADARAAALRCRGPERSHALGELQALQDAVRFALPEGGLVAREIGALRGECGETFG
jgi:serine/threonine-protein kinase